MWLYAPTWEQTAFSTAEASEVILEVTKRMRSRTHFKYVSSPASRSRLPDVQRIRQRRDFFHKLLWCIFAERAFFHFISFVFREVSSLSTPNPNPNPSADKDWIQRCVNRYTASGATYRYLRFSKSSKVPLGILRIRLLFKRLWKQKEFKFCILSWCMTSQCLVMFYWFVNQETQMLNIIICIFFSQHARPH